MKNNNIIARHWWAGAGGGVSLDPKVKGQPLSEITFHETFAVAWESDLTPPQEPALKKEAVFNLLTYHHPHQSLSSPRAGSVIQ